MKLDFDKIAERLQATRLGTVKAVGGYFGAIKSWLEAQPRRCIRCSTELPKNTEDDYCPAPGCWVE